MGIKRTSKLGELAKNSPSMNIVIHVSGNESIEFNLSEELKIPQHTLSDSLQEHPLMYGYLLTIRSRIRADLRISEKKKEEVFSNKLLEYKFLNQNSGKDSTKDILKALVLTDSEYRGLYTKYNSKLKNLELLEAVIQAMENKAELMRTLSANTRKEKFY